MFNIKLFVKICQVLGSTCLHENFLSSKSANYGTQWSSIVYIAVWSITRKKNRNAMVFCNDIDMYVLKNCICRKHSAYQTSFKVY